MHKIRSTGRARLASAVALLAPSLVLVAGPAPAYAAETTTRILRAPLDLSVVLPCANGGLGEVVDFDGTISEVYHVTVDETGGFHVHIVETQSNVHGIGATTGDRYASTRVNLFVYDQGFGSLPITSTQQLVFRIVGPGPGNDASIRITNHTTVNADGTITVAFDTYTAECEPTTP
ncbi:hypothetical protein U2F26_24515 [Micromonospora sp. 4G57]|uniref:Uncharacterized protein n=1 Tax=Micromonospora sicca TaxID=2202420 RepID=A0ABU5JIY4_9ACTN|nr:MULTISPECIES: hypothetical protein [unclassified Micromonospora]MDZ5445856.1 hypothetical protein [Micromonospora sp. 4G57]MDZ5492467.1 hypothetical protein [Micromonospora sp. 4G53]